MCDQVTISMSEGRDKTISLRARGGWQQFGCSGPSIEDSFVIHWVGVGVAQPEGCQRAARNGRADSLVKLQEPEPRQRVRSVVRQSECCQ